MSTRPTILRQCYNTRAKLWPNTDFDLLISAKIRLQLYQHIFLFSQNIVDKIAEIIKNPSIGASSEEKEEDNFENLDYQNIMNFSDQKISKEDLSEEIKNRIKFSTKSLSTSIEG